MATFVYVANFGSSTVELVTRCGTWAAVRFRLPGAAIAVATGPNCVTIEPALGIYLLHVKQSLTTLSRR